jgi:hypothetical protein
MIGLTGGSILKGVFGSKEAADVFLNSPDGEEFISKLALDDEEVINKLLACQGSQVSCWILNLCHGC